MMPCGARLDHEWGKAFWEKNNPAQYFSDFALFVLETWSLKSRGGSPTISGISLLPELSSLRTRRRFLFFGRRKKSRGRARGEKEKRFLSPLRVACEQALLFGRVKQVSRNRTFSRGSLRLPNS